MKRLFDAIDGYFFARRGAWPFGLLRIAWAAVALAYFAMQWSDIAAYYSDAGFLPRDMAWLVTRTDWKFTVLSFNGEAWYAFAWYIALLASLACSMLGIFPRISTIVGYVLMASFHERNPMTLGGGDTVLRNVGFILMIAPGIHALSLGRLVTQYRSWRTTRTLLPPITMPAWPARLLLWQLLVIYISSLWWKLLGTMWIGGSAVAAALHHRVFLHWNYTFINLLMPLASTATYATLVWEASWLTLLVPASLWKRLPVISRYSPKRWVLLGGVVFHGSIAIIMDVGSFPFALLGAYLGLLDDGDRAWLKRSLDQRQPHPIVVLYDGSCRLCRRSAFVLALLDAFAHVKLVDFRNARAKNAVAPHLDESQLDLAMHILLPDGSVRTGYDAFRFISWHLPLLWPTAPLLALPGISHLGRIAYRWIAQNRQKCSHDRC